MDSRYEHPQVVDLWSREWTYGAWLDIELVTLRAQVNRGVVPTDEVTGLIDWLNRINVNAGLIADIQWIEKTTKHDVVAFLNRMRMAYVNMEGKGAERWLHFGLTSSDVVDTAQGMRFRQLHRTILSAMGNLVSELTGLTGDQTPILGRTHGQVAEPMEMRARAWGWLNMLATGAADLSRFTSRMAVCKLSGPVGTYAHNPPEIEEAVARALKLRPHGPGATQIASRAPLAAWANAADRVVQACAKIAHDIRLMILTGEATHTNEAGQVGSSSMAHKQNPIRAEQIAGMARMSAGYSMMLSDLGTWLERDISMSSVERVAVPDLWHVTLHTIAQTTKLLHDLKVISKVPTLESFVSWTTLRKIERGLDVDAAREKALETTQMGGCVEDLRIHMANWPGDARS